MRAGWINRLRPGPNRSATVGAQMRSQSTKTYFKKLGIEQPAQVDPRTPDDNPFIESHFATIKTQPAFPGYFAERAEARTLLQPVLSVVQ